MSVREDGRGSHRDPRSRVSALCVASSRGREAHASLHRHLGLPAENSRDAQDGREHNCEEGTAIAGTGVRDALRDLRASRENRRGGREATKMWRGYGVCHHPFGGSLGLVAYRRRPGGYAATREGGWGLAVLPSPARRVRLRCPQQSGARTEWGGLRGNAVRNSPQRRDCRRASKEITRPTSSVCFRTRGTRTLRGSCRRMSGGYPAPGGSSRHPG